MPGWVKARAFVTEPQPGCWPLSYVSVRKAGSCSRLEVAAGGHRCSVLTSPGTCLLPPCWVLRFNSSCYLSGERTRFPHSTDPFQDICVRPWKSLCWVDGQPAPTAHSRFLYRRCQVEILSWIHLLNLSWSGLLPDRPELPLTRNKAAYSMCCFSRVKYVPEPFSGRWGRVGAELWLLARPRAGSEPGTHHHSCTAYHRCGSEAQRGKRACSSPKAGLAASTPGSHQ